jgi:hypothetical protein
MGKLLQEFWPPVRFSVDIVCWDIKSQPGVGSSDPGLEDRED